MVDSRKVIDYADLWNEASTSSVAASHQNGNGAHMKQKSSPNKANNGWSADGVPQTASSARKLRKILTKIELGDLESAESELEKMGPAKNNYEVQRALAIAKTGGASNGFGDDEEDAEDYDEDEEGLEMDSGMIDEGFNWQGAMNSNGTAAGRQLTHAEIWDDSALVDAWNAAEEEYKLFHAQRSAHEQAKQEISAKRSIVDEIDQGPPKKRSALWHDSPAKGSSVALAAKAAQEKTDRLSVELAERKKQAKALLARVAAEEDSQNDAGHEPMSTSISTIQTTAISAKKKLKGTTPPSSSISGNLAWHSACATVSRTPNAIGAEMEATFSPTVQPAANATTTPATENEDVFQNLAMAWYYAGYYQAMAMQSSSSKLSQ
jgi:hypothetical protein